MTFNFTQFRAGACVVLGAFVGALIALPLAVSAETQGAFLLLGFSALGAVLGYRKRQSSFFFYFCLIAVVALSSLISYQQIYR